MDRPQRESPPSPWPLTDGPRLDACQAFDKMLLEGMISLQETIVAAQDQAVESIQQAFEDLTSACQTMSIEVQEWLEALPKMNRYAFEGLCQRGWYPSGEMSAPIVNRIANYLQASDYDGIDNEMAAFVGARDKEIQSTLLKRFPVRACVLGTAFTAHRQHRYSLAIPVFLAQADGICHDLLGVQMFSVERGTQLPMTASAVQRGQPNPFSASLLSPLEIVGALGKSVKDAAKSHLPMNRHAVLHGLSLDYGTRYNSLRCMSLLDFLASIVA